MGRGIDRRTAPRHLGRLLIGVFCLAGMSVAMGAAAIQPEPGLSFLDHATIPGDPRPSGMVGFDGAAPASEPAGRPTSAIIEPAADAQSACQPISISSLGLTTLGSESVTVWSIRNTGSGRAMAQLIDAGGEQLPLGTVYLAAQRTLVFAVPDTLIHGGLNVATPCDSGNEWVASSHDPYRGHAPVLLSIH